MNKYYIGKNTKGWNFVNDNNEKYWPVKFGTEKKHEVVDYYRAKSRSKEEMQILLDHVNKQLEQKGTEQLVNKK